MEFQERGAIHFHLLLFNFPFVPQKELQKVWEACTREARSILDIRLVHGAKMIMAYISKYIAKRDERSEITSLDDGSYQHEGRDKLSGRFWGYINKELLPLGEVVAGVLTDRQTIKSLSSLCWSILGSDNPYNSLSFHLFCENARWLCERAIEEGGALMDEWEYTVKDHSSPKPTYSPFTEHFSEPELELISVPTIGRPVKGSRSDTLQPLIGGWVGRSSLTPPAQRISPYFENGSIV
jgi:hypothetical protein